MADNFDMKKFLVENKLGAYSRLKEVDEAKSSVSKEDKIQVIKEWIWFTCDEGEAKDDINKYNKMVDMYFADKDDVTKEDFKKIWNKVSEKYGVGDTGADSEAFPETWKDVQTGNLVNPGQVYEGEAAYEYEKGKAAGEKIEKEKLAKEDMGHDIEDAEAMKQMDFLAEEVDQEKVQDMYDKITAVISKAAKKLSDDDASALHDKLKAFFNKLLEDKKPVEETSELNEESVRMFKSDNPEGDKLVLNFLKRIAKDFDYPVAQAALFVKERIKKLGY